MSFLKAVKGWLGLDADSPMPAERTSRENPLFVYVKLPGNIQPLERGRRFEDPLEAALDRTGYGEITGGGSQLGDPDEQGRPQVDFCGIDVDLYAVKDGIALLASELRRLGAPRGTVLMYEIDGIEHEQPIWEA